MLCCDAHAAASAQAAAIALGLLPSHSGSDSETDDSSVEGGEDGKSGSGGGSEAAAQAQAQQEAQALSVLQALHSLLSLYAQWAQQADGGEEGTGAPSSRSSSSARAAGNGGGVGTSVADTVGPEGLGGDLVSSAYHTALALARAPDDETEAQAAQPMLRRSARLAPLASVRSDLNLLLNKLWVALAMLEHGRMCVGLLRSLGLAVWLYCLARFWPVLLANQEAWHAVRHGPVISVTDFQM